MAHIDDALVQRANLRFIRASMRAPMLSRRREFALARRWREHNDQTALHELVTAYARLVVATASRFRNYGLPMGDLVQEGNLGLMQAAARFEPERDVRFSTYAAWWVRAQMQDFILRNWSIVRTGTTAAHKTLFFNLRRLRTRIGGDLDGRLSREARAQISRLLAVPVADVEIMEGRLAAADQSLNAPIGEDGQDWQSTLLDTRPDPEETTIRAHDRRIRLRWLADALAELSPRERTIIRARSLREEGKTLEVLGRELGVSKERVRQLEQRAMTKLRAAVSRRSGALSDRAAA